MKKHSEVPIKIKGDQAIIVDRNEAMLSKDKQTIIAFMNKYDIPVPRDEVFWITVHKTITAITSLPRDFRVLSKAYLREAGFSSMDDGDL